MRPSRQVLSGSREIPEVAREMLDLSRQNPAAPAKSQTLPAES